MRIVVSIALLVLAGSCYGQQQVAAVAVQQQPPATSASTSKFGEILDSVKQAKKELEDARATAAPPDKLREAEFKFTRAIDMDPLPWAEYLADPSMQAVHSFLSEIEQQRIDKQVGSGANTGGSPSLVSKGSVPMLLGLAVENGAAIQETSGTIVTFRANPTGIIKALIKHDYLTSGPTEILLNPRTTNIPIKESDIWYRLLNKASVALSFDTSKGPNTGTFTAERSQLTGYSGHYDIINHRDPRDKNNQALWERLRKEAGPALAGALTAFAEVLNKMDGYQGWLTQTKADLLAASSTDIEDVFFRRAEALRTLVNAHPEVLAIIKSQVIPAANAYAASRVDLLNQVGKSLTLTFDYSNARQVVTLGNTDAGMMTLPPGVTNGLPDLGNFLLTASGHFIGKSEITANISGTRFNGRRVGPNIGRWRDIRAGFQIDVPLPEIKGVGKSTLTFSYLYLNLLEEPLGAKILVNDVEESRKGTINFGQAKLDFPIGSTGMHIPISMTFSNRTELIKEKDVRGHIGITFDLDKIFSKNQ
jgi:hypothetical protein